MFDDIAAVLDRPDDKAGAAHDIADREVKARARDHLELDALLHPTRNYAHPRDVVRDRSLSLNEKRAILASWASDACAVEAAPELRCIDDRRIVRWDDVMDALRQLDALAQRDPSAPSASDSVPRSPWLALCS